METKFEIEKGIPISLRRREYISQLPLRKLEIGDSFKIELEGKETVRLITGRIYAAAYYVNMVDGTQKKFTVRTIDNKNMRIWRIR